MTLLHPCRFRSPHSFLLSDSWSMRGEPEVITDPTSLIIVDEADGSP